MWHRIKSEISSVLMATANGNFAFVLDSIAVNCVVDIYRIVDYEQILNGMAERSFCLRSYTLLDGTFSNGTTSVQHVYQFWVANWVTSQSEVSFKNCEPDKDELISTSRNATSSTREFSIKFPKPREKGPKLWLQLKL